MPTPFNSHLVGARAALSVAALLCAGAQLVGCTKKCGTECAATESSASSTSESLGSSGADSDDASEANNGGGDTSGDGDGDGDTGTTGDGDGDGDGDSITTGDGDGDLCSGPTSRCGCLNVGAAWCADFTEASSYNELVGWCADRGGEVILDTCPSADLSGACVLADDCYSPSYYFYDGYAGGLNGWASLSEAMAACSGCSIWENP